MKMVFGRASVIDNEIVMDEDGPLFFNGLTGKLESREAPIEGNKISEGDGRQINIGK